MSAVPGGDQGVQPDPAEDGRGERLRPQRRRGNRGRKPRTHEQRENPENDRKSQRQRALRRPGLSSVSEELVLQRKVVVKPTDFCRCRLIKLTIYVNHIHTISFHMSLFRPSETPSNSEDTAFVTFLAICRISREQKKTFTELNELKPSTRNLYY